MDKITEYYNQLALNYDLSRFANSYGKFIDYQERRVLAKLLNTDITQINLDLACGTGRLLSFGTHGVDISNEMISISKAKYPNKQIILVDAENLPFENSYFDNIYSFHLMMHLTDAKIKLILEEASRIIKLGGSFIFDIPSKKRRKLTGYKSSSWHGGHELNQEDITNLIQNKWIIKSSHGICFIPIHRFPGFFRKYLLWIDNWLCESFLKSYASYVVYELQKI